MQESTGPSRSDSGRGVKKKTLVFEVECVLVYYTSALGTYKHSLAACTTQHTGLVEGAIQF